MDGKVCGQVMETFYSSKFKKLNLELRIDKNGTPLIDFEDWTGTRKTLFTLHVTEAVALKAVIDSLIINYHMEVADRLEESFVELKERIEKIE